MEWISCCEVGEIIEWIGFAIACWSLPAAAFALYTFSNIGPRAYKVREVQIFDCFTFDVFVQSPFIQHHQWYQKKFDNYPKERKAVIPFIW